MEYRLYSVKMITRSKSLTIEKVPFNWQWSTWQLIIRVWNWVSKSKILSCKKLNFYQKLLLTYSALTSDQAHVPIPPYECGRVHSVHGLYCSQTRFPLCSMCSVWQVCGWWTRPWYVQVVPNQQNCFLLTITIVHVCCL